MSEQEKLAKSIAQAEAELAKFDKLITEKAQFYTPKELVDLNATRKNMSTRLLASKTLLAKHS